MARTAGAGARRPRDARCSLVSRRLAQLRRIGTPTGDADAARPGDRVGQPDPRSHRVVVVRAGRPGGSVPASGSPNSASASAIEWSPTCPTSRRRLVAFLATASLGAVWSSCAPEFGVRAVIDRWAQIEPTVLLDRRRLPVRRSGHRPVGARRRDRRRAADARPRRTVAVPRSDGGGRLVGAARPRLGGRRGGDGVRAGAVRPSALRAVLVGDDGSPEADRARPRRDHRRARQGVGPALRPAPGRSLLWFTTTGWMMWNFLVSAALVGATVVLFDGDPASPDLSTLWRARGRRSASTSSGSSAPFVMACRKAGLRPGGRPRPVAAATHRVDGRAAAAGGFRVDRRRRSARTCRSDR